MKTLLEKARANKHYRLTRRIFGDDELELVMAWLNNEVTAIQVSTVLGQHRTSSNLYNFLAVGCRELYRQGKLSAK